MCHIISSTYRNISFPLIKIGKPNPEIYYAFGNYDVCIEHCDTILSAMHTSQLSNEEVKLLKGKCLFKSYKCQKGILNHSVLDEKKFRIMHGEVYTKAKDAIAIFDKAVLDSESSLMFDLAMMEYASGTNELGHFRRCLLCKKKAKLLRSHMCPHAILKEFSSGLYVPENLRVFDTSFAKVGHCKSPKEATMYALCKSCEDVLSINGEQSFMSSFFRVIYSKSDEDNGSNEICIQYGPWLYNFCVGILFRAILSHELDRYFSCNELYKFFLLCRKLILNPPEHQALYNIPKVYVIIGAHKARAEDKDYGFMNQVLNDAYLAGLCCSSAGPHSAHFLFVHIGIIHILTVFSSFTGDLPEKYRVNPDFGTYTVPKVEERSNCFPEELWELMRSIALRRSRGWLERPLAPLKRLQQQKMIAPEPFLDTLFHASSSVREDLTTFETNVVPSPDPNQPQVLSLLPRAFSFRSTSNQCEIKLPDNHQILFHYSKGKEYYFLAVGQDSNFSLRDPYVIYAHCEPGLQFSIGFYIDSKTLKFVEFLPTKEGKAMIERLAIIDQLQNDIQNVIGKCLIAKGIKCLDDILHLLELDNSMK